MNNLDFATKMQAKVFAVQAVKRPHLCGFRVSAVAPGFLNPNQTAETRRAQRRGYPQ